MFPLFVLIILDNADRTLGSNGSNLSSYCVYFVPTDIVIYIIYIF